MQEDDQGWSFTSEMVCTACVEDYALEAAIEAGRQEDARCDFCGHVPAAPLNVLLDAFVKGLKTEYEDALDGVYWDSREGGFQWDPKWETWELVSEFADVLVGPGLVDAVADAMPDQTWVEYNFAAPRADQALRWSWDEFCHAVRYQTRYVFWLRKDPLDSSRYGAGEIPAARILSEIGGLVDTFGLVQSLPSGSRFARARPWNGSERWKVEGIGTAPVEESKSNRMSPAGIPMFYGSRDVATAAAEAKSAAIADRAGYGWFETSGPCNVVDFTQLGGPISMFDPERGRLARRRRFLADFVESLRAAPRPKLAEIDYVPTQIVCEYLLRIFRPDLRIVGLIYPSALTGQDCVVLDVPNDRCVRRDEGWDQPKELVLGLAGAISYDA